MRDVVLPSFLTLILACKCENCLQRSSFWIARGCAFTLDESGRKFNQNEMLRSNDLHKVSCSGAIGR